MIPLTTIQFATVTKRIYKRLMFMFEVKITSSWIILRRALQTVNFHMSLYFLMLTPNCSSFNSKSLILD